MRVAKRALYEEQRVESIQGRHIQQARILEIEQARAVTLLQAVWRAHLARAVANKLRAQDKSRLKRSFSWSKKGKTPTKQKAHTRQTGVAGGRKGDTSTTTRIRRSLSFDRKLMPWGGERSDKGDAKLPDHAKPAQVSKQLLFILLHRGPAGLGLELDATNTVVNIVRGGAAERQGYFMVGDTIASVDGIPLRGRLLQDVMDRNKNSYSFDVWRLKKLEAETPKTTKPVRRSFSFDRKR